MLTNLIKSLIYISLTKEELIIKDMLEILEGDRKLYSNIQLSKYKNINKEREALYE